MFLCHSSIEQPPTDVRSVIISEQFASSTHARKRRNFLPVVIFVLVVVVIAFDRSSRVRKKHEIIIRRHEASRGAYIHPVKTPRMWGFDELLRKITFPYSQFSASNAPDIPNMHWRGFNSETCMEGVQFRNMHTWMEFNSETCVEGVQFRNMHGESSIQKHAWREFNSETCMERVQFRNMHRGSFIQKHTWRDFNSKTCMDGVQFRNTHGWSSIQNIIHQRQTRCDCACGSIYDQTREISAIFLAKPEREVNTNLGVT